MILLSEARGPDPDALTTAWTELRPTDPAPRDFESRDGAMVFELDASRGVVALMEAPIPPGELEDLTDTSWMWPDAAAVLENYPAHLIVSVSDAPSPAVAARLLTWLVAAALRTTPSLGVYWGSAQHLIRADVFTGMTQDFADGTPVVLWINFNCFSADGNRFSLVTRGMSTFDLMEFEIADSNLQPGALREFAMGIAGYLIENGPVISDGDTVGGSEDERIVVRHARSEFGGGDSVYRFEGL